MPGSHLRAATAKTLAVATTAIAVSEMISGFGPAPAVVAVASRWVWQIPHLRYDSSCLRRSAQRP